jgi:hypothetical protein
MRGFSAFLIGVIFLLLFLLLIPFFIGPILGFTSQNHDTTVTPSYGRPSSFDYTTYLLTTNPIDFSTYNNCEKLKRAVKYAVITGRPFKVDEIEYGSDLISNLGFPFIGNCPEEELQITIANGLNQTVCNFKRITSNNYDPDSITFGGVADANHLSFENCIYYNSVFSSIFSIINTNVIGPDENLNHPSDSVDLFYSPDYFYIKNGDYSHYFSISNTSAFPNAYNGAGRMKIYVGDASSKNGECTFNIYLCPRTAIAKSPENSTIDIFNIFRGLELYDLKSLPYYVRDLTDDASSVSGYSKEVYYWNYYDVKLDSEYRVETILNAIKEGLYLNVFGKGYFFAHPHWDIARDSRIDKDNECWNSDFDNNVNIGNSDYRARSIRFNCGDDNICSGELRIKIAIRYDNRTEDIDSDGKNENLNYISGVISFCDQGAATAICGNDIKEGLEECDKTKLGGKACADLGYTSGTLTCRPDCTFNTSNCAIGAGTCSQRSGTCEPVRDCTTGGNHCYCSNCLDCTTYPALCCCV